MTSLTTVLLIGCGRCGLVYVCNHVHSFVDIKLQVILCPLMVSVQTPISEEVFSFNLSVEYCTLY